MGVTPDSREDKDCYYIIRTSVAVLCEYRNQGVIGVGTINYLN